MRHWILPGVFYVGAASALGGVPGAVAGALGWSVVLLFLWDDNKRMRRHD